MKSLVIDGGYKLSGNVTVQGAKNGALPVLAATILGGRSVIHNCPNLSDVDNSMKILQRLGCRVDRSNSDVIVESSEYLSCEIPQELMKCMRSSVIFLGAMLAKCGKAIVSAPGGCELGERPIDLHLAAMASLGASVREDNGFIVCSSAKRLRGAEIILSYPSVGATENILLAAVTAEGRTVLRGAAREPEIVELAEFLNCMGGKVSGAGGNVITVDGVETLGNAEHTCIPDRIAAATYIAAAVTTRSEISLCGVCRNDMLSVIDVFERMGCEFCFEKESVRVKAPERPCSIKRIDTMPYPGFPTDAQAVVAAALATADGISVINETVFGSRFKYINELIRLGVRARSSGGTVVISGVDRLSGAYCECTDLRGGAAIVVAALGANGRSIVSRLCHIDRGYEDIEGKFASLGAKIYRT